MPWTGYFCPSTAWQQPISEPKHQKRNKKKAKMARSSRRHNRK